MPNWCSNTVVLQHSDPAMITRAAEALRGDTLFAEFVPLGGDGLHGWNYDLAVENWGTKWNGYDGRFNDDQSVFTFDTAWCPPIPILKKLAELTGQTFILEYIEYGMFFCGKYTASPEEDYDEYYADIKAAPEELLNELGYEEWEEVEA